MNAKNTIHLIGHLGSDPEVIYTENTTISKFSIGQNDKWTDKNGEKHNETSWHNCTAFGKLAEIIEKHLEKGKFIAVVGELKYNKWEDKKGNKRISAYIKVDSMEMLGGKSESQQSEAKPEPTKTEGEPQPEDTSDLPF